MTEAQQNMVRDAAHTGVAAGPGALVYFLWGQLATWNVQTWVGLLTIVYLIVQIAWRIANWREGRRRQAQGRTQFDE